LTTLKQCTRGSSVLKNAMCEPAARTDSRS
jgi:hypothetical protein